MNNALSSIEERRAVVGRGCRLQSVAWGMVVFTVLSLVMNAVALERSASLMPYGSQRDVCLSVMKPIVQLSVLLHADDLREWIESVNVLEGS